VKLEPESYDSALFDISDSLLASERTVDDSLPPLVYGGAAPAVEEPAAKLADASLREVTGAGVSHGGPVSGPAHKAAGQVEGAVGEGMEVDDEGAEGAWVPLSAILEGALRKAGRKAGRASSAPPPRGSPMRRRRRVRVAVVGGRLRLRKSRDGALMITYPATCWLHDAQVDDPEKLRAGLYHFGLVGVKEEEDGEGGGAGKRRAMPPRRAVPESAKARRASELRRRLAASSGDPNRPLSFNVRPHISQACVHAHRSDRPSLTAFLRVVYHPFPTGAAGVREEPEAVVGERRGRD
jgi:hypothetical protein